MTSNDPIQRVSVVSTSQVQIRPDHEASSWRPMFWWLLTSRQWTEPRPINAYVIEHRDGVVSPSAGNVRSIHSNSRTTSSPDPAVPFNPAHPCPSADVPTGRVGAVVPTAPPIGSLCLSPRRANSHPSSRAYPRRCAASPPT